LTTPWNFTADTVTADITLYARWLNIYTVTFNAKGGMPEPEAQPVTEGGTVTQPEDPTRENYYFGGWYTDTSCTTKYKGFGKDGEYQVSGNFTLYANWLDEVDDFNGDTNTDPTLKPVSSKPEWEAALSDINTIPGNYIVTVNGPITGLLPGNITSASTVSLRGTGSLALNTDSDINNGSLITVEGSATLILRGPTLQGKDSNNAAVVSVDGSGAAFIMESGTVTGNTGGGVDVRNDAAFTMNGGVIRDNTTVNSGSGSGVSVGQGDSSPDNAVFTMYGGTIRNNTNSGDSGAVLAHRGTRFEMYGGTIRNNATGGVGIHDAGSVFIMSGGTISDNTDSGVLTRDATFTMENGTISGNTSNRMGGGVNLGGTFTMEGGIISGNTAAGSDYYRRWGGGVGTGEEETFIKTGGTIYGGNAGVNSNRALGGDGKGHAVVSVSVSGPDGGEVLAVERYRDTTSGPGHTIITNDDIRD
jgi:uncharacterized repeat protein (TIGR02543 family)